MLGTQFLISSPHKHLHHCQRSLDSFLLRSMLEGLAVVLYCLGSTCHLCPTRAWLHASQSAGSTCLARERPGDEGSPIVGE